MPKGAASYGGGQKVKGPAGTASQRAVNQGRVKGRATSAASKVAGKGSNPTKQSAGRSRSTKRGY